MSEYRKYKKPGKGTGYATVVRGTHREGRPDPFEYEERQRQWRILESRGASANEIARALGVCTKTVERWRRDRRNTTNER